MKSLSYNAAGRSQIAGGDSVQALEDELASSSRRHDAAGLVSIVVREREERPVKVWPILQQQQQQQHLLMQRLLATNCLAPFARGRPL